MGDDSKFLGNTFNLMKEKETKVFSLTKLYMPKDEDNVEVSMSSDRRCQMYSFQLVGAQGAKAKEWFKEIAAHWKSVGAQKKGEKYFAKFDKFKELQNFCNGSELGETLSAVHNTGFVFFKSQNPSAFDKVCTYDLSNDFFCYCRSSACGGTTIYVIGCKGICDNVCDQFYNFNQAQ